MYIHNFPITNHDDTLLHLYPFFLMILTRLTGFLFCRNDLMFYVLLFIHVFIYYSCSSCEICYISVGTL